MRPVITVIIPNYNHAPFLRQRIFSVLSQTFKPDEIIVLDDCSTDNSLEIINEYISVYPEIRLIANLENSGSTFKQWNKGVEVAKGDWIWIAESDDVADENLLYNLAHTLLENENIVISYCQSYRMNENGIITGSWKSFTDVLDVATFSENFTMRGEKFIEKYLIHKNVIPNASAVLFKRQTYMAIGGAAEGFKTNGDWLIWLKMACVGNISFISQPLNNFRYHGRSVIAKAHLISDVNIYVEKYDFSMRSSFRHFLKINSINISASVLSTNRYFMSLDFGNKALYLLKKNQILFGLFLLIKASFYSKFQSGFIKRAIRK